MKTKFTVAFILTLACLVGFSQSFDKAKLDSYFDALAKNNKFMGSVAVLKDGQQLYARSVGFSEVEAQKAADEYTKYRIGSISKTFTSVLIFKAVEEGKLELNQTIDKFFPSVLNAEKITVSHLLYHRSGIHSFTDNKDYLSWCTQAKSEAELLDIIVQGGSDFDPNAKAMYSNSNYVLLTFILEKVFNDSYASLLQKYIAQPLALKNTFLGKKIDPSNNEAHSYRFSEGWNLEPETDMSVPLGAGAVVSTPSDLVKFGRALLTGQLLRPESLEQMKTVNEKYGAGLFKVPFFEHVGYGHTGGIDGFSSVLTYFPDVDVCYALTSNGTNYVNNNISLAVLSAVYGKPFEIPQFTSYSVSSEELDQYLGTYASPDIPLKIIISKNDKTLMAQATGQNAFPYEAIAKHKFIFEQAGAVLEFVPEENKMILRQGGKDFTFTKE